MIKTVIEWFRPAEKLPDAEGQYFISKDDHLMEIEVVHFAPNLHEFDDIDFSGDGYSRPGFFCMEDDYRYHEIHTELISYWAERPVIKEGE